LKGIVNRGAVNSLLLARIIYAVNWYNIGSVFSFIALDFKQNVSGLGFITGSFYVGLGIFQIPGGIVAAKIGPRKSTIYGTLIASAATFLSGLITDFSQLAVLRFFVGLGMAFVFGPGVALIVRYFRRHAGGLSVGLYNAAFYMGGALGLFSWGVFSELAGWRLSLATSGALGILSALLLVALVPADSTREDFLIKRSQLRMILGDKWLMFLGVGMFGMTGGASVVTALMVFYLEQSLKASTAIAGVIGGLSLVFALLSSPIVGRVYDRSRDARKLMFFSGIGTAIGLAVASIPTLYTAILSTAIVGFSLGGGLTVGFSAARDANRSDPEYEALAVSTVNSLQLFAGFFSPVAFSFLVVDLGYAMAWQLASLYTLVIISVILFSKGQTA
jgi:MFS family permease